MKSSSQLWGFAILAVAVIALVSDGVYRGFDPGMGGSELVVLAILGIGTALYRPRGWPSLAMGACALPLAIETSGAMAAALLAVVILLGRQSITWTLGLLEETQLESGRSKALDLLLSMGPAALAVLVAGWLGAGLSEPAGQLGSVAPVRLQSLTDFGALAGLSHLALAGAAYLGLFVGLTLLTRVGSNLSRGRRDSVWRRLRPFLLDALGWASGLALTLVVATSGWPAGLILGAGLVALSVAALEANMRARREREISNRLRDARLAGHRIIFHQPDLLEIARQVRSECRGVLDFAWFHLELRDPDGRRRHWGAGPDDDVTEGKPEPLQTPKTFGLGRRPSWKIVTRELSTGERILGRMKLWCDPRTAGEGEVDWLDAFLPEVASAIERAFLNQEARRDQLTDLPDRRVLESCLEDGYHQALAAGSPMSVIMVDLDHFKLINDRHGHAIGDQALVHVARLLEEHRREADVCCRYGGEEFALVLEDADGETALAVAERIRQAVEMSEFVPGDKRLPLRLSAGVASFPNLPIKKGRELIELADEALYEAKRRGRNRCLLKLGQACFRDVSSVVSGPVDREKTRAAQSAAG